jgi:hypothetical protein
MNDAPLMEAYTELRSLLANPSVLERVVSACPRLTLTVTLMVCYATIVAFGLLRALDL